MKLKFRFCYVSVLFICIYSSTLAASVASLPRQSSINHQDSNILVLKNVQQLTPKNIKQATGKRLTLDQRIGLFLLKQISVKKSRQATQFFAEKEVDSLKFNWGGFLLGLLLNIAGLLIAYLIGDRRKIKWAWLGFAFSSVILLLLFIL